jgi:molybdate transport system substrate-binding protein
MPRWLILVLALTCARWCVAAEDPRPLIVFAAASLTDVLGEIDAAFARENPVPVRPSFEASSALARQIESGAPAEVFISADEDWMNYLQDHRLLQPGSRRDLLGNQLVLIAPADSPARVRIAADGSWRQVLGEARIATGDPDSVPVGKYARAALTSLGAWDQLAPHLVRAENVRSALLYVARGEAPFGIVYATDALVEPKVRVLDTFPESSHPPIRYPVALTGRAGKDARHYLRFLGTPTAAGIFKKAGFTVLQTPRRSP